MSDAAGTRIASFSIATSESWKDKVSGERKERPGWYVYGRNKVKYGTLTDGKGAYVMLCARPSVAPRQHPHYNIKVRRGWRTRREAQAVADFLNARNT